MPVCTACTVVCTLFSYEHPALPAARPLSTPLSRAARIPTPTRPKCTPPHRHPHPPPSLRPAAEAIEAARRLERLAEMSGGGNRVTLSSLASIDEDSDQQVQQRLSLILKADASGSVEAVRSALGALPQDAVLLRYLLAAPGEITTSDIDLAAASSGMVLGFNVTTSDAVQVGAHRAACCPLCMQVLCGGWPRVVQGRCKARLESRWAILSFRSPPHPCTHQLSPRYCSTPPPPPHRRPPSGRVLSCAPTPSFTTSSMTSVRRWRAG